MPIETGTRLGAYQIVAPIGAGGMGEVYRARDTKLDRDVAIKVLPAEFFEDKERVARFEREAKALAALNHHGIAAVHSFEAVDGRHILVMELVEGEGLDARIARGAIPLDEALPIARQIAEGLEAAHERGIVHRDLKPANVMVTPEGRVKILDFGLAKAFERPLDAAEREQAAATAHPMAVRSPTAIPTVTAGLTQGGVILGTAAYMSPEQARGKPVDKRADIWAFGAVFFEMLTGKRAFEGETLSDLLAAVLTRQPDLASLPPGTPNSVRELIARCLRRDAHSRQRDMGDARILLEDASEPARKEIAARPGKAAGRRFAFFLAAVALAAALLGALAVHLRGAKAPAPLSWHRLTFDSGRVLSAGFLPGGKVVYSAAWNGAPSAVYSTRTDYSESREIVPAPAKFLSVSKSGEMAVLLRAKPLGWSVMEGTLARVPADGGTPRELLEKVMDADWSPDGSQLAIVRRVQEKVRLEFPPGRILYETVGGIAFPRLSPKGDRIAFVDYPAKGGHWGTVSVVDLVGHKTVWTPVREEIEGLVWSPSGEELWYGGEGERGAIQLFAAAGPGSKPRLVTAAPGDLAPLAVDAGGRILANRLSLRFEVACTLPGDSRPRDLAYLGASQLADLSPDGKRILFTYRGPGAQENYDVSLRPTDGGPSVRLGRGDAKSFSQDGRWVTAVVWGNAAFGPGSANSNVSQDSILLLPTGAGETRSIGLGDLWVVRAVELHPDGRRLIFNAAEKGKAERLWVKEIEGGAAPAPITPPGFYAYTSAFLSPDGRWAAAADTDDRLLLIPVDGGEPKRISGVEAGEIFAGWTADGKAIYVFRYSEKLQIHRVDLETGARQLWKEAFLSENAGAQQPYAVVVARNAEAWAAGYQSLLGELYLVEGLK